MSDTVVQTQPDELVPKKDLMAIKSRAEGLEQKLKEAESAHTTLTEGHKKQLDEVTIKLYATEASVKKLEEQLAGSAGSAKESAEVKAKLEAAEKRLKELSDKALDYRKKLIVTTFNIPIDVVKDKTLEQLDLYEEALKAVSAARGVGNYAVGGGTGGGADTRTPREKIRTGFDILHPDGK